ncbi:MAG: SprB repeat-containing protein, partial [Flavobacteriales bacterium]|nr:SprB repeat-containing protein [Flavobacteriales bacterium]
IGGEMPLTLQKYSSAGALQWTYSTPYDTANGWLGSFATDDAGNSYVSNGSGGGLEKISTGGNQIWGFNAPGLSDEYWTISFNCDQSKLIVGGTSAQGFPPTTLDATIFDVDVASGGILNTQVVMSSSITGFPPQIDEVRSLTSSKNSRYYFLTHSTIGAIDENFSPCFNGEPIFIETSGYGLGYKCETYRPNNGNAGIKAIRANDAFVYTVNGTNVQKRSLADGSVLGTASIPGGNSVSGFDGNQMENAGIDIDECGNVYVGSGNGVYKFDADLNMLTSASTSFKVYDVEVSLSGEVVVAGATGDQNTVNRTGYVQSFGMGSCDPLELICCDPNICPAGPFCETDPPITLTAGDPGGVWTGNGITNASTGVFDPSVAGPGVHTIVYTLQCGADSIEIEVGSCQPLEVCLESNGDLTALTGTGPYSWDEWTTGSTTPITNEAECTACGYSWFFVQCLDGATPVTDCATGPGWVNFATGITVTPPSYPVRVVDATGDSLVINDSSTLPACTVCTPPTLATTQQDVNCAGGNDGAIDLTVTGNSTYDFDWDNAATTEDISNLIAGDYTVIVTDQNDQTCTATETVTILEGGGPTITGLTATDAACGAADGQIDITATGATQYSIDGGTTFQGTGAFTNLIASSYTIVVEDANGCQADSVISVINANGPTIDNIVTVEPSCGATDGSITVTATGAAGYSIDNGTTIQTNGVFTGLGAGTYDIYVGDISGCLAFDQVIFTVQGAPVIDNIATTDPACGATDGAIVITASGGTDPLNYSIDNGLTTQASGSFTGLTSGTYDIIVNDPSNCPVTQQVTLNSNGGPSIDSVTETDATCGASDGEIEITATGGIAPLQYSIDNGATFQTGTSFTGLAAGNFDIVVEDDSGCQTTRTATISNSGAPVITNASGINAACNGVCDGSIGIIATGASQYSIDGGTTFQPLPAFSDLCAADYDIVVDDGAGCQSFDQITIIEPAAITAASASTDATCSGSCDGTITITANGGSAPLAYSSDNGITFQSTGNFVSVCDG